MRCVRRVVGLAGSLEVIACGCGAAGSDGVWRSRRCSRCEVALFRLLESWGVRPDVVAGHSVGESRRRMWRGVVAGGCVRRWWRRGRRLMQALPAGGAMVAVRRRRSRASGGAGGSAAGVVGGGGERPGVGGGLRGRRCGGAVVAGAGGAGGAGRSRLRVSHAFHSPLMEPMLAGVRGGGGRRCRPPVRGSRWCRG